MSHARLYRYVVIAAMAASMLMYEILLTRVCSLRLFFHFAFLVISNCLLGIAASGALITLYQESWRRREQSLIVLFCAVYMVSLISVYAFLCLAADRRGVSFYRRDRIARELGLDDSELSAALARLRELDLVAYQPFRRGAADGFHQVLSLPTGGPPPLIPVDMLAIDRLVAGSRA